MTWPTVEFDPDGRERCLVCSRMRYEHTDHDHADLTRRHGACPFRDCGAFSGLTDLTSRRSCPACGVAWEYAVNGLPYSRLVAVVDRDRVFEYACPDCDERWPSRGVPPLVASDPY